MNEATAPVTQDVVTIPRKLPEGGRVNLVGLTRDQLRDALIAAGTPEKQAKMRVGQIWQWIYQKGVRDFGDRFPPFTDIDFASFFPGALDDPAE